MALEDFLSTPSGYATPDQLAQVRQYADLLMKGGQRDQPITNFWQGPRMMADALSGGLMRNRAGQQQMANLSQDADRQTGVMPFSPNASAAPGPSAAGPAAPGTVASVRNNNPGAQWPGPVASAFGATGAQNLPGGNKIATFPDPVHGAAAEFALLEKNYGGMPLGAAINKWSGGNSSGAYAQYVSSHTGIPLNTPITPQLLRSPQGIALGKAIASWEAGGKSPLADEQWMQAHQMAFGATPPQGGQTADLSGRVGGAPPAAANAPAAPGPAMAAGNTPPQAGSMVAAGPRAAPSGVEPPMPTVGAPQFGSEYSAGRPSIDQQTMHDILASPTMDPAMKQGLYQMYLEQHLPVDAKGPGGHWIVPDGGRGKPLWVPDLQKYKEGEYEVPATADEHGNMTVKPFGEGPQTTAPPSAPPPVWQKFGPPASTQQPPGPQGALTPPGQGAAPGAPADQLPASMLSQGAMPPGANPTQVASLDPKAGIGPVSQTPPPSGVTPQAAVPTQQVAQAGQPGQPGPLGSFIDHLKQWEIGNKAQQAGQEATAKAFSEGAETERQGDNEAATKSATGLSQLQLADKLVDDPNFLSAIASKPGLTLRQLQAQFGKNPNAARAIENFNKIIASQTLPELSAQTKKMGQIRLGELMVVKDSLASTNLTPAGIHSVLGIMMRAHQLNIDVAALSNSYAQGWRLGSDGKPIPPELSGKRGYDYDWQPTLQKFLAANPIITPELRANWEKNFGSNLEELATKQAAAKSNTEAAPGSAEPGKGRAAPPPGTEPYTPGR